MKINVKKLLYIFLIIPFIKPYYFSKINNLNTFFNVYQILSFGIIVLIYVMRKVKISNICMWIIGIEFFIILSSFLNEANVSGAIINMIQVLAFSLIVDYGMKNNQQQFIKALLFVLEIVVIGNFYTILKYTHGINDSYIWLLGRKNNHFMYILPLMIITTINLYNKNNKFNLNDYTIFSICIFSIILVKSSTSLVGLIMFFAYFIFKKIIEDKNILNINVFLVGYIILFLMFVVFRAYNIFSFIIVNLLDKELTLTGRTEIWNTAIELIKNKIFMGYGLETEIVRIHRFNSMEAVHAHNFILEFLYQGGIVLLSLLVMFVNLIRKKIIEYKNTKIGMFFSWGILIYLVMWLTEVYTIETFSWMFIIFFYIDFILRKEEINDKNSKEYCV